MLNLRDLTPLRNGSSRQRQALAALQSLNVFSKLRGYDPILASTHTIGLDTANSDLDIICQASCLEEFDAALQDAFGELPNFETRRIAAPRPACTATFCFGGFSIEIYGEDQPVEKQNAFRHLMICNRLLRLSGPWLRGEIRQQRRRGMKMEMAFARQLGLSGEPYSVLLQLEHEPDWKVKQLIERKGET